MKVEKDLCYRAGSPICMLDLYLPDKAEGVMLFFHGGGLKDGTRRDQEPQFRQLAASGIAVASADYRMYPWARWPDFLEDAAAAAGWLQDHAAAYGLEETPLGWFLGGSSAGSYIAMMLCFDRRFLGAQGLTPESFVGFFFDAGQPTAHFQVLAERGEDPRCAVIDETAPLFHVREPRPDSPRILMITADQDMPARYEQNLLLRATLRHFGWPEEKLLFRYIRGYSHCRYTGVQDAAGRYPYADMIEEFIRCPQEVRDSL